MEIEKEKVISMLEATMSRSANSLKSVLAKVSAPWNKVGIDVKYHIEFKAIHYNKTFRLKAVLFSTLDGSNKVIIKDFQRIIAELLSDNDKMMQEEVDQFIETIFFFLVEHAINSLRKKSIESQREFNEVMRNESKYPLEPKESKAIEDVKPVE